MANSSCSKEGGQCLSSYGMLVSETRPVGGFDSIAVFDHVNLFLTQDTVDGVVVESGKNILSGITTKVINRQLVIHNNNKCNWLRDYGKPVNIHVTVRNLQKLFYNSSGNVTSTNNLTSPVLGIDLWGGCGSIDLSLDVYSGTFIQHLGTANLTLRGLCRISSIYAGDFGPFHCEELETGYTYITNKSSNNCFVKADRFLRATIQSIGNIYYSGDPDTLQVVIQGSGQVIPY